MKTIIKLALFCCVLIMGLASCDSTANEIKMEKQTGDYKGTVYVSLYVPDHDVELDNPYYTVGKDTSLALCTQAHENTILTVNFLDAENVSLGIDSLNNIQFNLNFLEYYLDENGDVWNCEIRDIYQNGLLATVVNIVNDFYLSRKEDGSFYFTSQEYIKFLDIVDTLTDNLSLSRVETGNIPYIEEGVAYVTYDSEKESFYQQFSSNNISYTRHSNVSEALTYVENVILPKLPQDGNAQVTKLKDICTHMKETILDSGTISDTWGWMIFSYSNYQPDLDMQVQRATGLLDALSVALFGMQTKDGEPVLDKNNRWVPTCDLWLLFDYNGSINESGTKGHWELIE